MQEVKSMNENLKVSEVNKTDEVLNFQIVCILKNYILNNKVFKCREAKTLSNEEVEHKIITHQDIGIQHGNKLDIYCSPLCAEQVQEILEKQSQKRKGQVTIHIAK